MLILFKKVDPQGIDYGLLYKVYFLMLRNIFNSICGKYATLRLPLINSNG